MLEICEIPVRVTSLEREEVTVPNRSRIRDRCMDKERSFIPNFRHICGSEWSSTVLRRRQDGSETALHPIRGT